MDEMFIMEHKNDKICRKTDDQYIMSNENNCLPKENKCNSQDVVNEGSDEFAEGNFFRGFVYALIPSLFLWGIIIIVIQKFAF